MHESARRRQSKPRPSAAPPARRGPAAAPGAGTERLSAFYASGPAVPLAAPGPKKHVAVTQQKPAAVGRPGDRWEREADDTADKVTHGQQAPEVSRMPSGALGAQRQADEPEAQERTEEPEAQRKEEEPAAQEATANAREPEEPTAQPKEEPPEVQRQEEGGEAQEQEEKGEAQEKEEEGEAQEQAEAEEPEAQEAAAGGREPEEPTAQSKEEPPEAQSQEDEGEAQEQEEKGEAQEQEEEGEAQEQAEEPEAQEAAVAAGRRREKGMVAARAISERGAGEPLASSVRGALEAGLGSDLSSVRVHAGGSAGGAAKQMRARAFTHKNHIWLGPGESQSNLKLMAHEATHVLQQEGVERRQPAGDLGRRRPEETAAPAAPAEAPRAPAGASGAPPAPAATPPVASGAPPAPTGAPPALAGAPPALAGAPPVPAGAPAAPTGAPPAAAGAPPGAPAQPGARPGGLAAGAGGRGRAAAAGGPLGVGSGELAAAAGPAGEGPAVPHPGAAAAAAARLAGDRRRMAEVKGNLGREAFRQKGPAATRPRQAKTSGAAAAAASEAAPTPANEPISRGEAVHTGKLEATETERGKVQPLTFLQLVDQKLAKMKTPQTMEQMDDFKDKGGAGELKEEVAGGVGTEVGKADGKIRGTLKDGPKPEPERVPTPLGPVPKTPHSARLGAPESAPAPRAEEEVSLEPSREKIEADLAEHRLTKERLEKANDPRFTAVQKSREEVHEHADRAPAQFRREEAGTLATGRRELKGAEALAGAGMRGAHGAKQGSARGHQTDAMDTEKKERERIAGEIEKRYKKVEDDVRGKLEWLAGKDGEEGEVDRLFTAGEKQAREDFEGHVDREIKAWKRRRYGGRASIPIIGGLVAGGTWLYDKARGIDHHVQGYFDAGRVLYIAGLRATIESISATVETALGWCNAQIAEGKKSIQNFIDTELPREQRRFAKETAKAVFERFDELREEVDATREELADRLAERYRESEQAIDERIKEMQAENRGLVERFVEKVKEIIAAIRNFRNKIGPILAEAGDIVDDIIDDPIGFLGNLLDAVGRGFSQFKEHIEDHLKRGVIAWLFGNLATAGIQLPKEFSLSAMGGLVLDVLGLSFDKLKARAARMVGPRAMGVIEKVTDYLGTLYREGPAGLWQEIEEDVGNLKDQILEEIKSWVITRIITAAVKKLAMMFNPVGAIIQAILTIYNVVMFFLENIDRILELVRTIVRAAADVVRGKIQTAADKIENALGMTIPLILAFLARLVGLSGVAEKVRSVIMRFKTKIDKAITKFLRKLVAKFKAAAGKVSAKAKQAAKEGKAAVKKLIEWWKKPRKFKAGKKVHSMFFAGDRLKVASTERTVDDLVEQHRELSSRQQAAGAGEEKDLGALYRQTLTLAKAVEDMKKRDSSAARKKPGGMGLTPEEAKVFDDLKANLKTLLLGIEDKSGRPVSDIQYRLTTGESLGKHTEAVRLSIKRPPAGLGSVPSARGTIWGEVSKRKVAGGEGNYYELGHLISQDFFGKGNEEANLVPIYRKTNQKYEKDIEQPIKQKVWDEGKTLRLDAHAEYGGSQNARRSEWLSNLETMYPTPEHRMAAKGIIEAEMKLPDKLKASAWELTTEGETVKGEKGPIFTDRPVEPVFPDRPPELGEAKREKPSLSRSNAATLNNLGISQQFARLITNVADPNHPPKDFAELEQRVWTFVRQDKAHLPNFLQRKPDLESWTRTSLADLAPLVPGIVDL